MEQRVGIRNLVQQVIDLLAEIALDDRHGPKLYSRFLKGLLASPLARLDPSVPDSSASSPPRARSRSRKPAAKGQNAKVTGNQSAQGSLDQQQASAMMLDAASLNKYTPAAASNFNLDLMRSFSGFGGNEVGIGKGQGGIFGVHHAPSPVGSSPSPPPAESVSSFDHFRPAGGIDPYAPDDVAAYVMHGGLNGLGGSAPAATGMGGQGGAQGGAPDMNVDMFMSDYFQPELPFDEEIVRSIQDLSDPSGWQDISIPCECGLPVFKADN